MRKSVLGERSLRSCLGRFATGVAVVTFDTGAGPRGLTINSFTSVSLEPPLVLVSIARRAKAHDLLVGRPFCVNVLGAEQETIARTFAGGPPTDVPWIGGDHAPGLAGVFARLECRPWRAYDGGDHTLFLGEVMRFGYRDGAALAYHASTFQTIAEDDFGVEYLI
jgi:flavin reductase (DIM6/NTAB) family NADH-FMN oxidoreductase RutF